MLGVLVGLGVAFGSGVGVGVLVGLGVAFGSGVGVGVLVGLGVTLGLGVGVGVLVGLIMSPPISIFVLLCETTRFKWSEIFDDLLLSKSRVTLRLISSSPLTLVLDKSVIYTFFKNISPDVIGIPFLYNLPSLSNL